MSRFFAFGCSFTKYSWITWADILGAHFNEYQNWGQAGAGNYFIFNSLVESHLKNKISKDDTVGIMWSNVLREDRYKNKAWVTPGGIYSQNDYSNETVNEWVDIRGFYIRDLSFIYAAQQLLEKIGCRYFMCSIVDLTNPTEWDSINASDQLADLMELYGETLSKIKPSVHNIIFNFDWASRPFRVESHLHGIKRFYQEQIKSLWPSFNDAISGNATDSQIQQVLNDMFGNNNLSPKIISTLGTRSDSHPTPLEHLEYLTKVLPEYPIADNICAIVAHIDYCIRHEQPFELDPRFNSTTQIERW